MPRALIVLVAVVVLLTAGVIGVLAMRSGVSSSPATPQSPAPEAVATPEDESPAPVTEVATRAVPVGPAVPSPAPMAVEAAPTEEAVTMDAKVAKLLDSLTEEETKAVMQEMGRRQMRKWQEQMKYQLPSDMKLSGLQWHNRGAYKLDEAQRTRIKQLNDSLKPRLEVSLQASWDQENALREQIMAAQSSGRIDEMRPLIEQMQQVQQQINTVKTDLDKEYRELLRGVLTPEQMEYLESNQGYMIQSWNGTGGGPGNMK